MIISETTPSVDLAAIGALAHDERKPEQDQHNLAIRCVAWNLADGVAELINTAGYFFGRLAHRNGYGHLLAEIGTPNLALIQTLFDPPNQTARELSG